MSHSSPFIDSTAAAPRRAVEVESDLRREVIVSARWAIHAAIGSTQRLDATGVAGASVELWSEAGLAASIGSLDRPVFVLTFWRQDESGERRGRTTLAAFASNLGVVPPLLGVPAPPCADFQLAIHGSYLSLDVTADRPLLRLTHCDQPPARCGTGTFCRSILPELLGLRGGQYRFDEVRIDRARLGRCAARLDRARRAV